MISAPNLRLRSNGSSIGAVCLIILSFVSCTTSRKTTKSPSVPPKTEEKVRVYDPASGTYILVPRDAVKVDTIHLTEDASPPLVSDEEARKEINEKKDKYEISLLIPFNAPDYDILEGQIDSRLIRFLQYYAGMKIAVEEFDDFGYPVRVRSYDTHTSIDDVNEILKDIGVKMSDVIVGPYDKENIESVAAYGLQNQKIVISPWLPAFNIEKENPYFIQVIPGLNSHAEAIMDYIGDEMRGKKVYLVARNNPGEINRLQSFKKNHAVKTEDLIIDDASVELERTNLSSLLVDAGTIFVMPYYSKSDETFVNSFMRKLHADKGTKEVIVFGLPQWTGFSNLNPNYMESLSVHISSSSYIDTDHPSYQSFRNKFYTEYHTNPDPQAFLGYDLMHWLGKTLSEKGKEGLIASQVTTDFGLASGFDIQPVYAAGARPTSELKVPLYYENSRIRILKFINQDFVAVR